MLVGFHFRRRGTALPENIAYVSEPTPLFCFNLVRRETSSNISAGCGNEKRDCETRSWSDKLAGVF